MLVDQSELDTAVDADAMKDLPDECRRRGYYCVSGQQFREHGLAQNALRQGWPVLVEGVGDCFDSAPFTVDALSDVGKRQNAQVIPASVVKFCSVF